MLIVFEAFTRKYIPNKASQQSYLIKPLLLSSCSFNSTKALKKDLTVSFIFLIDLITPSDVKY